MGAAQKFVFDPKAFLAKIGSGKTIKAYKDAEVVFAQGDSADAVFYIQSGKVKLTVVSKRGKQAIIAVVDRGNFVGEGCLAGQPLRMSTASAMQKPTIMRVEKKAMVDTIHREPHFAELFIAYLLSRNIRIEEDLVDQLFNSAEKRLARILLLLAHYGKESIPQVVIPKMSQESLAEMVGTTRSRVSYFMNRFKKMGFITYDDGLHVHSSLLNVVLHD